MQPTSAHNHQTRIPAGAVLAVCALALLILVAVFTATGVWLYAAWPGVFSAVVIIVFGALALGVAGGVAIGLLALYNRLARWRSVEADKTIALTRATVQRFPTGAQSITLHDSSRAIAAPPAEIAEPPPPALPGMVDLAAMDVHPSDQRIMVGLDEHGPITVTIRQLCHGALVGATGNGKSMILRLILSQLQAIGAHITLIDPHFAPLDPETGEDWRAIERRLRFPPAVTARQIGAAIDYTTAELDRRLELRRQGKRYGPPVFLAFDELPVIASLVADAVPRLGRILREGRKVGVLTIGASQSMLVKEVGGSSALRDQYRTCWYVGGDKKSAAALLDIPERDIDDGPLGDGVVLLRSAATSPARLVRIPLASNAGVAAILGEAPTSPPASYDGLIEPPEAAPEAANEGASEAAASPLAMALPSGQRLTIEEQHILDLVMSGKGIGEVVQEVWGIKGGEKYAKKSREVLDIMRRALGGSHGTTNS